MALRFGKISRRSSFRRISSTTSNDVTLLLPTAAPPVRQLPDPSEPPIRLVGARGDPKSASTMEGEARQKADRILKPPRQESRGQNVPEIVVGIAPHAMDHDQCASNALVSGIQRVGTVDERA